PSHKHCCVACRGSGWDKGAMSDETDDVQLPVPSRTSGVYPGGVGRGSTARGGGLVGGRSSRKVVEGLRTASSRRLNYSSFTSNGSNKGVMADTTDGSATGGIGGGGRTGTGGGGKACTACGIQFTWRMRRHHCRGCKQAVCDPCSRERLQLVGGDSKRHRVCHPCLKQHLAEGHTREDRLMPSAAPSSLRSSPFESQDTSRNVSRDPSRHGSLNISSNKALATYVEDQEHPAQGPEETNNAAVCVQAFSAVRCGACQRKGARAIAIGRGESMLVSPAIINKNERTMHLRRGTICQVAVSSESVRHVAIVFFSTACATISVSPQQTLLGVRLYATSEAERSRSLARRSALNVIVPKQKHHQHEGLQRGAGDAFSTSNRCPSSLSRPIRFHPVPFSSRTVRCRYRQVQSAKDQNPLALPWFTGKHSSPCSVCEDLWKVAWSAREDFLRDLAKAEGEKGGYQLGLWRMDASIGGRRQAIRLRVEMEVAVPLGFAMRWLASLTARGGVYYPYSDTVPCDMVESDNGALSVACAHWPTNLSGPRRCTVLRYVSEDGSPPPGMEGDPSVAGKPRDPRPTIVFTTIEHPIMREWAQPGVDVEVFPSGLVLEEMESPAGAVTKVHGLIGWDNKGTLQHMAKMSYMTERADR
ncbi:unnamed protein product, partial [Scytosiphon promiscuus]